MKNKGNDLRACGLQVGSQQIRIAAAKAKNQEHRVDLRVGDDEKGHEASVARRRPKIRAHVALCSMPPLAGR